MKPMMRIGRQIFVRTAALYASFLDARGVQDPALVVEVASAAIHLKRFQAVFERYSRPVFGFLRDLLGDWSLAEEMSQAYGKCANRATDYYSESQAATTITFLSSSMT